jgi:hypothetical protein
MGTAKKAAGKAPASKTAGEVPPKKTAGQAPVKKAITRAPSQRGSVSAKGRDPAGGLNAQGRKELNEQTGGHLRPGVKGAADTPEKKQRKGSFLRRHFANPPGPVEKGGKPTRQALQAAAWGEPVPRSGADEKKLAAKGSRLLEEAKEEKAR